ncbi:major facilitator superfamily domain-containing protein [Dipodascopsis uninucleata]
MALEIPDYTPGSDEEKKLVRKIDLFLLPTIFLMYFLSYMDRINVGNAEVAGMAEDLHLSSHQYSIILIVMIVFYVSMEVPTNMILSRSRPSIFLPTIMILWGTITGLMSLVKSYQQLIACRALVGIAEAGFAPGVLLLFSSWYRRSEQSVRFGIYISAPVLSGAFGGILSGAITSSLDGVHGIRGWRWLFIVEGASTVGWALIASFILLDFPTKTRYLSEREKKLAMTRLQYDRIVNSNEDGDVKIGHLRALRNSLSNWRTYLFTIGYSCLNGISGMTYFYPTLTTSLGYTGTKAQYMTVPIYAVAFVCNLTCSYVGDRQLRKYRGYLVSSLMVVCAVCSLIVLTVYNPKVRYAFLVFNASSVWSATAATLAYASSSFGGMDRETRGISLALVNGLGTGATIYNSFLFPSKDSPRYIMGFSVITAVGFLGIFVFLALQILLTRSAKLS